MHIYLKLVALIIALSIFTSGACHVAAEDNIPQYEEEISVLTALQLLSVTEAELADEVVKRDDFAAYIAKLINLDSNAGTGERYFYDVAGDNPNAAYINYLASLGIMTGDAQGNFNPDKYITVEEAIKSIVTLLGYTLMADANGGYPVGYLIVGDEIGLLRGLALKRGDNITRSQLAKLIYNSLDVDIYKTNKYSSEGTLKLNTVDGDNLLWVYHNIRKTTGIITANQYTGLNAYKAQTSAKYVAVDGELYNTGATYASDYLGYKTEIYYYKSKSEDEKVIKYIKPAKNIDVLVLEADEIDRFSDNTYSYYDNRGRIKTAKLSRVSDKIFNNKYTTSVDEETLIPLNGTVTLVDNDGDGLFDVAKIMSYKIYLTKSVDSVSGRIDDKYIQPVLNIDDKKIDVFRDGDSDRISITDISVNDILYVYADKEKPLTDSDGNRILVNDRPATVVDDENSTLYTIVIQSKTKINGMVTSVNRDENTVVIDDVQYDISIEYLEAVLAGDSKAGEIKVGDTGEYIIDSSNRIVSAPISGMPEGKYGYLLECYAYKGVSGDIALKFLGKNEEDEDDIFVSYYLADKVKFNGRLTSKQDVLSNPELYDNINKKIIKQLIFYCLDGENRIKELNTAVMKPEDKSTADCQSIFTLDKRYLDNESYYASYKFSSKYTIKTNTQIFVIPGLSEDGKNPILGEDNLPQHKPDATSDEYSLKYYFGQDTKHKYFDIYDVGLDYGIGAIVIWSFSTSSASEVTKGETDSTVTIVDRVSLAVNDEGVQTYKISGIQGQTPVNLWAKSSTLIGTVSNAETSVGSDSIEIKELKQGDLIFYKTDARERVNGFTLVARTSTNRGGVDCLNGDKAEDDHHYGTSYVGFGKVMAVYDNIVSVDAKNTGKYDDCRAYSLSSGTDIHLFDTKTKKITKSSFSALKTGDYLAVQIKYADTYIMLIVR